ncbi:hypothetical protein BDV98DRAFT_194109 [Pterulicium gracile]|uniref:BTB domain-containing protein n=1 Tax=Pterulicium gracile TaxID=1884261 RepID=A0A5C3QB37_9AGAR|nr:hypothetical protein BDV98DRAFT_194109 [Pterula gracilis]
MAGRIFNDEYTADVVLESSDGLSFYAHKSILSAYSGTFADADHCSSSNDSDPSVGASTTGPVPLELVECSESAEVLSALIRFMYRDEVPIDLQTMDKGDFFDLADAAEKYDVWSLKQLLRTYMPNYMERFPLLVLHFALTHGDTTLGVDAAAKAVHHRINVAPAHFDWNKNSLNKPCGR